MTAAALAEEFMAAHKGGTWKAESVSGAPGWYSLQSATDGASKVWFFGPNNCLVELFTIPGLHGFEETGEVLREFGDAGWPAPAIAEEIRYRTVSKYPEWWLREPDTTGEQIAEFLDSIVARGSEHVAGQVAYANEVRYSDTDDDTLSLALQHPNCPVEKLVEWAERGHFLVIANPRTPVEQLRKVAYGRGWDPRRSVDTPDPRLAVLRNPNVPADILHDCVTGVIEDLPVNASIFIGQHASASAATQVLLAQHVDWTVRLAVAANKNLCTEARRILETDTHDRVIGMLVRSDPENHDLLARAAKSSFTEVRREVAAVTRNQKELLQCAMDPEREVRRAVLGNPCCTKEAATAVAMMNLANTANRELGCSGLAFGV